MSESKNFLIMQMVRALSDQMRQDFERLWLAVKSLEAKLDARETNETNETNETKAKAVSN